MDNESLVELFGDFRGRQFWIKPWGYPGQLVDKRERFDDLDIHLNFAKQPVGINAGDILFVHRINAAKLACVAKAVTPPRELKPLEIMREPKLKRWPWVIEGKNLTPKFGRWWQHCSLKTFALAAEYSRLNPSEQVNLGSLNHGNDKLRVPEAFARFLIEAIVNIE
jgi:hypothetical protein